MRFDTPIQIANALVKYLPKGVLSILEPSVGKGELIKAAMEKLNYKIKKVVCLDIDKDILQITKKSLPGILKDRLYLYNNDFLEWSNNQIRRRNHEKFDCIIMNPPFNARASILVNAYLTEQQDKLVPIEVAFLINSFELLKEGGTILAIMPSSFISSKNLSWVRASFIKKSRILKIHELPRRAFKGLDSRVYLLVLEKLPPTNKICLMNHDLSVPEIMELKTSKLSCDYRFDFKYYEAAAKFDKFIGKNEVLRWGHLSNFAQVFRGQVKSPIGDQIAIHTTDFRKGNWDFKRKLSVISSGNAFCVKKNDILVKRVGRNSILSFGIVTSSKGIPCSDCVLIIRPKSGEESIRLLFAIRSCYSNKYGATILERGTGASFLRAGELQNMIIPYNLHIAYPKIFSQYYDLVINKKHDEFTKLEQVMHTIFFPVPGLSPSALARVPRV